MPVLHGQRCFFAISAAGSPFRPAETNVPHQFPGRPPQRHGKPRLRIPSAQPRCIGKGGAGAERRGERPGQAPDRLRHRPPEAGRKYRAGPPPLVQPLTKTTPSPSYRRARPGPGDSGRYTRRSRCRRRAACPPAGRPAGPDARRTGPFLPRSCTR